MCKPILLGILISIFYFIDSNAQISNLEIEKLGWRKIPLESKYIDSILPGVKLFFLRDSATPLNINSMYVTYNSLWFKADIFEQDNYYPKHSEIEIKALLKLSFLDFLYLYQSDYRLNLNPDLIEGKFNLDPVIGRIIVTKGNYLKKAKEFTNQTFYNFSAKYCEKDSTEFHFLYYFDSLNFKFQRCIKSINGKLLNSPYHEETNIPNKSISIDIVQNPGDNLLENADGWHHYYRQVCEAPPEPATFYIHGLTPSLNYQLKIIPVRDNPPAWDTWTGADYYVENLIVNSSGDATCTLTFGDPLKTGICRICVYQSGSQVYIIPSTVISLYGNVTVNIPNSINTYLISYCRATFSTPPMNYTNDYLLKTKNDLLDTYDKQVNQWQLALGVRNINGVIINEPAGLNNTVRLAVNGGQSFPSFWNTRVGQSNPGPVRTIGINCKMTSVYPGDALLYTQVEHEFFHGIQFSFNYPSFASSANFFIVEGQARFIQSVQSPNEEFSTSFESMYNEDANDYIHSGIFENLFHLENSLGYSYCLFWRYLFERYSPNSSIADKLKIIRASMKGTIFTTNSNLITYMDHLLSVNGGTPTNYAAALDEFAKYVYFNNPGQGTWDASVPNTNFYSDPPTEQIIYSPSTWSGAITYPFDIKYYEVSFNQTGNFNIEFDRSVSGSPLSEFRVSVYKVINGNVVSECPIQIDSYLINHVTFSIENTSQKLVISIVRVDNGSGTGNYTLNLKTGEIAPDFIGTPTTYGASPLSVNFTDNSSGNNDPGLYYQWELTISDYTLPVISE